MANTFRIVYMGNPDFAVRPLEIMLQHNYNVVAVVTGQDKPAGRGKKINESAVKVYAKEQNLPILQPESLKDESFLQELQALNIDLIVVVAFKMLPKVVWQIPKIGTINIHASLLPQYRGAAPINWAIINGEKKTGVTSFLINEVIDTGNILLQKEVDIADDETAGTLHDKLQESGSQLLLETLQLLENGKTQGIDQKTMFQNESDLKPAPKIFKDKCKINWNDSTENINNHIRGFSPYPGAWTQIQKNNTISVFKIFVAHCIIENHTLPVGVIVNKNNSIAITTQDGFIQPIEIQIEGKRRMNIHDFLNGFSFEDACIVN
ncbi:MAG: methionyl-tRNA formyltransferase [Bacteroidales bacterium]|nr:methionyl-tRNA formyltransferase [Bacteroidales bacterium]